MTPATIAKGADLIDRLAAHKTLGNAPRDELEWLAAHGELRRYKSGDELALRDQVVAEMMVLLYGHGAIYINRGAGRRKFMEWSTGDVTGLLPFSRLTLALGEAVIEEDTEMLIVHRDHFAALIRDCPTVTATLVHVMLDRARHFAATDWQDDKMVSLGRLAAGLSHELNNPASAAARSAKVLSEALAEADEAAQAFGASPLTDAQRAFVKALRRRGTIPPTTGVFSALERADREDEFTKWLDAHHADLGPASALAESGISLETLDELAEALADETLDTALRWIAAGHATQALATDVERATTRIYDLVSAVKRFTYMDRATVAQPTNIAQGLADTVSVLSAKARAKSAAIRLDVPADLPLVQAYAGELNQVWSNLLENAIDAVGQSGQVVISATLEGTVVVVRVIDDGHGIPPDIKARIFDPFFTTKTIGQGTGLGLDIARRIVRRHDGQIDVESRPGRTELRITLPVSGQPAA